MLWAQGTLALQSLPAALASQGCIPGWAQALGGCAFTPSGSPPSPLRYHVENFRWGLDTVIGRSTAAKTDSAHAVRGLVLDLHEPTPGVCQAVGQDRVQVPRLTPGVGGQGIAHPTIRPRQRMR